MDSLTIKSLNNALKQKQTITIMAQCTVRYSGKTENQLDKGDRIIIIKPDSSLMVHQLQGLPPSHYMNEKSTHTARLQNQALTLNSINIPKQEFLTITINQLYSLYHKTLIDNQQLIVSGTSKDMVQMVLDAPHLIEEGFTPSSALEQKNFQFIDIVGTDKDNTLVIVECKQYPVDVNMVEQVASYRSTVSEVKDVKNIRAIIAAPNINDSALDTLNKLGLEFKQLNPPQYLKRINKNQKKIFEF